MLARRPGYSLRDVSLDCMHPLQGRLGTEYMVDLLANWLERGLRATHRGDRADGGTRDEERRRRSGSGLGIGIRVRVRLRVSVSVRVLVRVRV